MTAQLVTGTHTVGQRSGTPESSPLEAPATLQPTPPRRVFGLSSGQLVSSQLALLLVVVSVPLGVLPALAATVAAAAMLLAAWGRPRGRWMSQWLGVALRYRTRRRRLRRRTLGNDAASLLAAVHPGAFLSTMDLAGLPTAIINDSDGLAAMLELGETGVIATRSWYPLPSPASLLPAPAPDTPPVRIQLVLHAVSADSATPAGASYRQLTGGGVLAAERAILVVRVQRADGWSEADLERALTGAIRKIRARLSDLPHRPLGEVAALRTMSELAGFDGTGLADGWTAMAVGGLLYGTYAVDRWPHASAETQQTLLPRLLRLPAASLTVALTAGPWRGTDDDKLRGQLRLRVGAGDVTQLNTAGSALEQVLAELHARPRRLDGEHLDGLLGTLPLADPTPAGITAEAHAGRYHPFAQLATLTAPHGGSGLMIGLNRHSEPVSFRLFRPEPTRAVLVGAIGVAQLIAVRSVALGAHVLVQTTRPWAWEAFTRGLGQGSAFTVMAPGPVAVPAGSPRRPLLSVVDAGPVAADRSPGSPWHSTLVVRDELSTADVDVLGRADLALLQPLAAAEAAVAVSVLGLSRDQEAWLAKAQPEMIGLVHRRSVRWAAITRTGYEQQLIPALARSR